jgi:1-acyl-sn-glycerol-3-phosphate acyltransferase
MDITYVGTTLGWRNLKFVGKQELTKVPILSRSMRVAGHVLLDRTSRRSQLKTFKDAVQLLKDGAHLCMFAEGTRSRDGRLTEFKGGAFKMAQSAGAPIVPISICYAHLVNPTTWVFPMRPTKSVPGKVIIGKPIETKGKTDDELNAEVRAAMIQNLPECQRPLEAKA